MSNLTEQNIEFVTRLVNDSRIKSFEMKEDLIDHFCCAIEEYMNKGLSFEKSFDQAYRNICPNGLDEIQRETIFLLTSKNNTTMKQSMLISGYLTLIGITTTIFLKSMHIQGGSTAMLISSLVFVFLFLPALFLEFYKREWPITLMNKLMYLFGYIGFLFLVSAILFKLMHWGGAFIILISSLAILNFLFFPFLFFKMYRKTP